MHPRMQREGPAGATATVGGSEAAGRERKTSLLAGDAWAPGSCRKTVKVEARYPEESAAVRDLVFGKKGIIKRIRDITPETKLVYCKWDDAFQAQPVPYLKVAQCGSFITEFPEKAVEYLRGMDIDAMLESVCSNPSLPDGFKQKLSAWSRKF